VTMFTLESGMIGLIFIFFFLGLIIAFRFILKDSILQNVREISAFTRLRRAIGYSVEAGQRLHITLGNGGIQNFSGAPGVIGLIVTNKVSRSAAISDRPPVATSGEPNLAILSQDVMRSAYREVNAEDRFDPISGQLTGFTPFSYAAGALPVIFDNQVSVNLIMGSFGTEVGLISDAAERTESLTIGGSENLNAQAVLFASTQEPLVGEELFGTGAYLQVNKMHDASLIAQDILRWVIILLLIAGGAIKLAGLF
jgi:Domain of unknown function (DUF6754)